MRASPAPPHSAHAMSVDDALVQLLQFRVGRERFAISLAACEEVLEWPGVERVAGMQPDALGVFRFRGQLLSAYTPERVLGVERGGADGVMLVVRANGGRIALALDDVEEVIGVDMDAVGRPAPRDAADGLLLGIARHGTDLVAVIDVDALVTACTNTLAGESR